MHRSLSFGRWGAVLAGALLGLALLGLAPLQLASAEDRDAGPAMATSHDPNEMTDGSRDPDALVTGSRDPDGMTTGSEDPDKHLTGSRDPDDLVTTSEDPDDKVVESTNLDDLRTARPDRAQRRAREGTEVERDAAKPQVHTFSPGSAGGSGGGSASSLEAKLAMAKARLDGARRDVERWDAAYSRSLTSNTSRGQDRAEIITKRREANAEVEDASRELDALAGQARRAGVNPMIIEGFTGSP